MDSLKPFRRQIRKAHRGDEALAVSRLITLHGLTKAERYRIEAKAADLIGRLRATSPTITESFLGEYGLSNREGIALMCLAEALLRVPDAETIDALISDKVAPADWGRHLGHSSSPLVNASTWALLLTGRVFAEAEEESLAGVLHGLVRRLGEPVIRAAVEQAMKELGRRFVLGETIEDASARARAWIQKGYTYSYDMLGEAALTAADARHYHRAYAEAIAKLAPNCGSEIRTNPGISVKLSALHPRYEYSQRDRITHELVSRTLSLAVECKNANMGFNIDAEEADRLDLSLDLIEAVLGDPSLAGWDGFGIVVQAYDRRALHVLDWVYALAGQLDRRLMVRLVKGAYWDSEIKQTQAHGLNDFPVFTRKAATDVSYIACARKLLSMSDRLYAQFGTHNAHTVTAILEMAGDGTAFEFQRLHGMGERLHDTVLEEQGTRCRIYAPVGTHRDLLAYLVRRLLENGANSSFVNQIVDETLSPQEIARDPFDRIERLGDTIANPAIVSSSAIFEPLRANSRGWDLADPLSVVWLDEARTPYRAAHWRAHPMVAGETRDPGASREIVNPADPGDVVGTVQEASAEHAEQALAQAIEGFDEWSAWPAPERARCLERVANLYEEHTGELFALTAREAGKTLPDCVAELREAADFLRYYAREAARLEETEPASPRGVFVCISPWNFPLAIFTGQIAAALAAGNAVIAKPAEQTPLIAAKAIEFMREAGIPEAAIQLLPGHGPTVGGALTSDSRIAGVCFTGSIETARTIHRSIARHCHPETPLIAETGGINAMLVDSTALPEQAVRDIVASAFQSAGQRCSALRVLYVQEDVADRMLEMLFGAMDELQLGDPWDLASDVGPVIDSEAQCALAEYCYGMEQKGRLLKRLDAPGGGCFLGPVVFRIDGIGEVDREVFGPVLHVATYEAEAMGAVAEAINAKGYGLTFGLHTRIDQRVQEVVDALRVGNIYVNRNQIGSIVASQPFGGEGLSGTGPKAGGPNYLRRFRKWNHPELTVTRTAAQGKIVTRAALTKAIAALDPALWAIRSDRSAVLSRVVKDGTLSERALALAREFDGTVTEMPGPTGESNRLTLHPRGIVLCLGPEPEIARAQAVQALAVGNAVLVVVHGASEAIDDIAKAGAPVSALDGQVKPEAITGLDSFDALASMADEQVLRALRMALAAREGTILPLVTDLASPDRFVVERHLCIDTTAAGGNASLLAASG